MCVEHLSDHHRGEGGMNMSRDSRDISNLDTFFCGKGVWIRELGTSSVTPTSSVTGTSSVTPTEVEPATLSATSGLDTSHQLEESSSKEVCIYVYTNQPHSYILCVSLFHEYTCYCVGFFSSFFALSALSATCSVLYTMYM